jgi:hypothetical protein
MLQDTPRNQETLVTQERERDQAHVKTLEREREASVHSSLGHISSQE